MRKIPAAVGTLLPGRLCWVFVTVLLMIYKIFLLMEYFTTPPTGLIYVSRVMNFLVLLQPWRASVGLATLLTFIQGATGIMFPIMQGQSGLIPKIFITWFTVVGGLFHVRSPDVGSQSLGIIATFLADRTLFIFSYNCFKYKFNRLICIFLTSIYPNWFKPVHCHMMHWQSFLDDLRVDGRCSFFFRLSG